MASSSNSRPGTGPGDGEESHAQHSQCIGSLEHHLHKVFASVRVPGEDFVYAASKGLFDMLDDFCDEDAFHVPRLPCLLKGASGTGKSALLSNWLLRRQRNAARARSGLDEFVFWHAVGCSRQSLNVNSLIRRLMVDLKTRFDLARDVPIAQERLSWELARFLEAAAKKGRLIIVIDGLHRLVTNEDTEASLAWLPLEFPPNVRVILTITDESDAENYPGPQQGAEAAVGNISVSSEGSTLTPQPTQAGDATAGLGGVGGGGGGNAPGVMAEDSTHSRLSARSKIIVELARRQWQAKTLQPLDRHLCRAVVENYIQKSVQTEAAQLTKGPFLTQQHDAHDGPTHTFEEAPGILLFDTQVAALLTHSQGGTPLFLRLFLRCTHYAITRGFSLWHVWDDWLSADTVQELLRRILFSFENGFTRSAAGVEQCTARTIGAGGLAALRLLYPWHPNLREPAEDAAGARADVVAIAELIAFKHEHSNDAGGAAHGNDPSRPSHLHDSAPTAVQDVAKLSRVVRQNLGDQLLLQAAAAAQDKFSAARKRAEENIEKQMHAARSAITHILNSKIEELTSLEEGSLQGGDNGVAASLTEQSFAQSMASEVSESSALTLEFIDEVVRCVASARGKRPVAPGAHSGSALAAMGHGGMQASAGGAEAAADEEDDEDAEMGSNVDDEEASLGDENNDAERSPEEQEEARERALHRKARRAQRESERAAMREYKDETPSLAATTTSASLATQPAPSATQRPFGLDLLDEEEQNLPMETRFVDPAEGMASLPAYFKGGSSVAGFHTLLGNALALLYVARHGLKEQELWSLLASLQRQEEAAAVAKQDLLAGRQDSVAHAKSMVALCFASRGPLEDLWRIEDSTHTGRLSPSRLLRGMQKLHPSLNRTDMLQLLEAVGMGLAPTRANSTNGGGAGTGTAGEGSSYEHYDAPDENERDTLDHTHYTAALRDSVQSNNKGQRSAASQSVDSFSVDFPELLRRVVKITKAEKAQETKAKISRGAASVGASNGHDLDSFAALGLADAADEESALRGDHGENTSLGPVLEESLLLVLCALGVLHSPEHKVLVLPSDADIFRQVVHAQFVDARGGESTWHGHLIRHFASEPNSMRRCEELPWHLQICRRWISMKDALVDLNTFGMMYDSSDLRDEFMAYWVTLTCGPMYVTHDAHKAAVAARQRHIEEALRQDRHRDPELALLCIDMDMASAMHMTDKEAAKYRLRFQVGVFDVVEEFNRSVELWVAATRPEPSVLRDRLLHVAAFLAEFGYKLAPTARHPFLRQGVELRMLNLFDVNFDILRDVSPNSEPQPLEEGEEGEEVAVVKKSTGPQLSTGRTSVQPVFPTPMQLLDNSVFYLRWMWVQFPWLCLSATAEVGGVLKVGGLASVLAEVAATGGKQARRQQIESEEADEGAAVAVKRTDASVARSTRLWDVKKFDPAQYQIKNSFARLRANINAAMTPQTFLDGMDLTLRRVRDDIIACGLSANKIPPKYRRSLEQEESLFKNIPHAYHSKKSTKHNTLFPSLDSTIKERNEKTASDASLYANATQQLKRGGPGLPMESSLESELKRLADEETMAQWNMRRGGALPSASAEEVEYEREFERTSKLRALSDRVNTLVRDRSAALDALRRDVDSRDIQDEEVSQFMLAGEAAIAALKEKLQVMTEAVDEGRRLNNGYVLLLEMMQSAPPSSEQHIKAVQQQVALCKQQLADLRHLRLGMYLEAEKVAGAQKKLSQDKISYYRTARAQLAAKRAKQGHGAHGVSSSTDKLLTLSSSESADAANVVAADPPLALQQQGKDKDKDKGEEGPEDGEGEVEGETMKQRLHRQRQEKLRRETYLPTEKKFDAGALANTILNLFKPWEDVKAEADMKARATQFRMMWDFISKQTSWFVPPPALLLPSFLLLLSLSFLANPPSPLTPLPSPLIKPITKTKNDQQFNRGRGHWAAQGVAKAHRSPAAAAGARGLTCRPPAPRAAGPDGAAARLAQRGRGRCSSLCRRRWCCWCCWCWWCQQCCRGRGRGGAGEGL